MTRKKLSISDKTVRMARAFRLRYLRWQNRHVPENIVLILIAIIIGILTGIAAAVLKRLVMLFNDLILLGVHMESFNIRFLIWPLVGILLTSIFQRYVVKGNLSQGTRIIRQDLDSRHYRLKPTVIFNSLLGCSLTMGLGASGGTEGPTALSGSAIASNVGQWFGLSRSWLRLLVGIGAGAGISAIFKSPIGGVLFTLEVLQMELTSLSVLALIISCLFASATAFFLSDFTFDIFFIKQMPMDPHTLGWVALLGLFCGLYSIYYNYTKNYAMKLFEAIKNPWVGAVVTGLVLSVCIFMFPALFGEGFGLITSLVNDAPVSLNSSGIFADKSGVLWTFIALGAILLLKGVLVSASCGNGGVAGDFVPTFFAGGIAGFLFATLVNHFCGLHLPVWYFSLIGMGCVMAGSIHAPLMAIFILCETTNTFAYIFPYLLAISVCYATVKIITPKSWYGSMGHDDIMALLQDKQEHSLKSKL